MISKKTITDLCQKIVEQFDPQKIILFGSYAYGQPKEESDIDLLVILDFEGKSFWKSIEILNFLNAKIPLDLLARTPKDTEKRYQGYDPLIREALDKGLTLYARDC